MSRKDEIFESSTGLLSIAGGKLTGYRKMAQRIVDLVTEKFEDDFGRSFKKCFTNKIVLSGGIFKDDHDVKKYTNKVFEQIKTFGFDPIDARYLVSNYGRQTDTILARFMALKGSDYSCRLAKAELWFTLKFEMAHNPQDFFIRRTGRLYFKIANLRELVDPIIEEFVRYFNWDDDRKQRERNKINTAIFEASNFESANG